MWFPPPSGPVVGIEPPHHQSEDVFIQFEGDSLTQPAWGGLYPGYVVASFDPPLENVNWATGGMTMPYIHARGFTIDSHFRSDKTYNILTLLIGTNDLGLQTMTPEELFDSIKSYCLTRQEFGWKMVLLTILPNTHPALPPGVFNTNRHTVNDLIRGDDSFYDALADVGGDPVFGADSAPDDGQIYYVDKTHTTPLTNQLMTPYVLAAIEQWTGPHNATPPTH